MRAIIDIGTNSVRLLMAEKDEKGEWKTLRKELRSTRLGEGMTDKATPLLTPHSSLLTLWHSVNERC